MIHYPVIVLVTAALCISGAYQAPLLLAGDAGDSVQIDTPEEAAEFSSRLANEKCQKAFGISPFTPESYSAKLLGSKWQWGKVEPPGIRGYSAEVGFDADGSDRNVRVVLHTDALSTGNPYEIPLKMDTTEQEE